eukprot:15201438-Ditylum_brightwellii.AAC.1
MLGSHGVYDKMIKDALINGTLKMEDLDAVVHRNVNLILSARNTLEQKGKQQPVMTTNANLISNTNHALSKKVTMQCAILLRNNDNFLPLPQKMEGKE